MTYCFALRPITDIKISWKREQWARRAGFKFDNTLDYFSGEYTITVYAETEKELSMLLLTLPGDLM